MFIGDFPRIKDSVYIDEGITGTSAEKRDELNRLIRDCKKGLIDRVIVKSVSRLARNTQDLLIIIRTLKDLNVSVYFEEQGIDSNKLNSEMIVTFPGMAAQQESESISGNMRWSYKRRMEAGEFNTCKAPFGYSLIDSKQLVINEEEAAVVRRIFDMYLHGYGMQTIAVILNREGIKRRSPKKHWKRNTIRYILSNEKYMSDAILQKTYATDSFPFTRQKNRGEREMYYVEGANPAIISREIFESVKRLREEREKHIYERKKQFALSCMLFCPECGMAFRRQVTRDKAYWVCTTESKTSSCRSRRVREDGVYHTFSKMIFKLKYQAMPLLADTLRLAEKLSASTGSAFERIKKIDSEIEDLSARNLVIVRLFNNGILSQADYSRQSTELNARLAALRSERLKKADEDENAGFYQQISELYYAIEECTPGVDFDRELFDLIVEKIVVNSSQELTFTLIGGIELTETIDERWRCATN